MRWIGRKIYQYLKECEEFKKDSFLMKNECSRLAYSVFDSRVYESYFSKKTDVEKFFHLTPQLHKLNDNERAELDKISTSFRRLIDNESEVSHKKVRIPRTECLQPAPKQKLFPYGICTETGMLVFCNDAKDYLTYKVKQPERVPFEHFKNKRKMKTEVKNSDTHIITSEEKDGKFTITIEPKNGAAIVGIGVDVTTAELPKEPVLPKELLNPKPELQAQYDTLAKLIATRDYYNGGIKLNKDNCLFAFIVFGDLSIRNVPSHNLGRYFLKFKSEEIAMKFLENFRNQIESVKHLI